MSTRIPPPPDIPPATWKERLLLVWLPLLIGVAVVCALVLWAGRADAVDKQKVKPGAMLVLSCPGAGVEQGGAVEWFDKRGVSLGIVSGTVVDGTVQFGPAPKRVEYAVAQLDCAPPDTTTTSSSTTTTTPRETTTTTLPETTTSTSSTTTTSTTTTSTTLAPTTTSTTTTTTLPGIFLTGTAPTDDQGRIIYGPDFVGLPIPGGNPPTVQACPPGTHLDFAASTFEHPDNVTVDYLASFDVVIVTADLDTTGTVSYRLACVP